MSERKVKLTIAYDGSGYHGWQRQEREIITVQQVLEGVIVRVFKHPVKLRASGRTDTGVHAAGQVVTFRTRSPIPSKNMPHAINTHLPRDIRVLKADEVTDDFDANLSAKSKLYRYRVYNHSPMPAQSEKYCYHFYHECDVKAVQRAAAMLIGEHDFSSFAGSGHERQSSVRTLMRCQVWQKYHEIYFDLEASGFLYHMVRNIVGTLLEIGRGHWPVQKMSEILSARDRAAAGPMIPPNGLCLQWVRY